MRSRGLIYTPVIIIVVTSLVFVPMETESESVVNIVGACYRRCSMRYNFLLYFIPETGFLFLFYNFYFFSWFYTNIWYQIRWYTLSNPIELCYHLCPTATRTPYICAQQLYIQPDYRIAGQRRPSIGYRSLEGRFNSTVFTTTYSACITPYCRIENLKYLLTYVSL